MSSVTSNGDDDRSNVQCFVKLGEQQAYITYLERRLREREHEPALNSLKEEVAGLQAALAISERELAQRERWLLEASHPFGSSEAGLEREVRTIRKAAKEERDRAVAFMTAAGSETSSLRVQVTEATSNVETLQSQLKVALEAIDAAHADILEQNEQMQNLTAERDSLMIRLDSCSELARASTESRSNLEIVLRSRKAECAALTAKLEYANTTAIERQAQLEATIRGRDEKIRSVEAELGAMELKFEAISHEHTQMSSQIEALSAKVIAFEESERNSLSEITTLTNLLDRAAIELEGLEQAKADAAQLVIDANTQASINIAEAHAKLAVSEEKCSQLALALAAETAKASAIQERLQYVNAALESSTANSDKELLTFSSQLEESCACNERLKAELECIKDMHKDRALAAEEQFQHVTLALEEELRLVMLARDSIKLELESLLEAQSDSTVAMSTQLKHVARLEGIIGERNDLIQTLETAVQHAKDECASLHTQLTHAQTEKTSLEHTYTQRITDLQDTIAQKDAHIFKLNSEVECLHTKFLEIENTLQSTESERIRVIDLLNDTICSRDTFEENIRVLHVEHEKKVSDIEARLRECMDVVHTQKVDIEEKCAKIDEFSVLCSEYVCKEEQYKLRIAELETRLHTCEENSKLAEISYDECRHADVRMHDERVHALETEIANISTERDTLRTDIQNMHIHTHASNEEIERLMSVESSLNLDIENLRKELADAEVYRQTCIHECDIRVHTLTVERDTYAHERDTCMHTLEERDIQLSEIVLEFEEYKRVTDAEKCVHEENMRDLESEILKLKEEAVTAQEHREEEAGMRARDAEQEALLFSTEKSSLLLQIQTLEDTYNAQISDITSERDTAIQQHTDIHARVCTLEAAAQNDSACICELRTHISTLESSLLSAQNETVQANQQISELRAEHDTLALDIQVLEVNMKTVQNQRDELAENLRVSLNDVQVSKEHASVAESRRKEIEELNETLQKEVDQLKLEAANGVIDECMPEEPLTPGGSRKFSQGKKPTFHRRRNFEAAGGNSDEQNGVILMSPKERGRSSVSSLDKDTNKHRSSILEALDRRKSSVSKEKRRSSILSVLSDRRRSSAAKEQGKRLSLSPSAETSAGGRRRSLSDGETAVVQAIEAQAVELLSERNAEVERLKALEKTRDTEFAEISTLLHTLGSELEGMSGAGVPNTDRSAEIQRTLQTLMTKIDEDQKARAAQVEKETEAPPCHIS